MKIPNIIRYNVWFLPYPVLQLPTDLDQFENAWELGTDSGSKFYKRRHQGSPSEHLRTLNDGITPVLAMSGVYGKLGRVPLTCIFEVSCQDPITDSATFGFLIDILSPDYVESRSLC